MEVTWHEEAGVLVLSLWQGQTCRSTFQMSIQDAPALIGFLSSALGDAVSPGPDEGAPQAPRHRSRQLPPHDPAERPNQPVSQQLASLLRRWARRRRAEIVPLRGDKGAR